MKIAFPKMQKTARLFAVLALLLMLAVPARADDSAPASAPAADKAAAASGALDQPMMSDKDLTAWAQTAAADTMTFDYRNFQQRFISSSPHFTKTGWEIFSSALKNSGAFDELSKKNESLTSTPASKPVIRQQGAVDGKYRWTVDFALNVHRKNTDDEESDSTLRLSLIVTRVPPSDSADGVQISDWETR